MKTSIELKKERTAKIVAQRALADKAKAEKRELTDDENTQFDSLQGEIDDLNPAIERAEKFEQNELMLAGDGAQRLAGAGASRGEERELEKVEQRFSINRAFRLVQPGKKLDGVEREINEIGLKQTRDSGIKLGADDAGGFNLPISMLSRATQQTVSQDSGAYGGALVQNAAPVIVDPLRPKLFLEDLGATFMTGLQGGDVPLIVASDFAMEFLAEGASITRQKKQYAGPSLSPKRAGGAVEISNRLIMQSSPDVEALIMTGLRNGFSQLLESASINGAGGVAPTGLLSLSGVLAGSSSASASATRALVLELEALIEQNNSTEKSLGFLMSPWLKAILKQVKTDAGSGIFILQDDKLDGFNYVATSLMPALNSGVNFPLIFGDFAQMVIGQWGAINIKVNPFSADLEDSVRVTLNTHADMQIANPKAFAKNSWLTA